MHPRGYLFHLWVKGCAHGHEIVLNPWCPYGPYCPCPFFFYGRFYFNEFCYNSLLFNKIGKFMKSVKRFLVLLIIALAIYIGFLPTILSSEWGKSKLVSLINDKIPGKIEIAALSIQWLGPQTIEGLQLFDPEGISIFKVERAVASGTLFQLIKNDLPDNFLVENLDLHLITDLSGSTNLKRALKKRMLPAICTATPSHCPKECVCGCQSSF